MRPNGQYRLEAGCLPECETMTGNWVTLRIQIQYLFIYGLRSFIKAVFGSSVNREMESVAYNMVFGCIPADLL